MRLLLTTRTLFREVLRSLTEEAAAASEGADRKKWQNKSATIEANMYTRALGFSQTEYPYGSEFSFDTTGQEEVVVWLSYFANASNSWADAAKRTVTCAPPPSVASSSCDASRSRSACRPCCAAHHVLCWQTFFMVHIRQTLALHICERCMAH